MDHQKNKKILLSFFQKYPLITFEDGEKIIRPQELSNNVFYVIKGTIRISTFSPDGEERTLGYLNPELYGNTIVDLIPRDNPYYIEAFTEVQAWRVSRNEYMEFISQNPHISISLSESLLKLIQDLYEQITWLKAGDAYTKVIYALFYLAKHLGNKTDHIVTIKEKITHQMIANLTGLTRETVSKQINQLERKQLVSFKNSEIILHDLSKLKLEAENEFMQ